MRVAVVLAAWAAWCGTPPASAAELSVIMAGAVKGDLTVAVVGPRERRARLKFDDRGRGPDITTISRFDDHGLPLAITVEGLNYARRPLMERFSREGGKAQWQSNADSGSSTEAGFYVLNESNAEDLAALARALLDAPQRQLSLLPAGRARIEKILDHSFAAGAQRATATLYAISGLDLSPSLIWLDDQRELFMSGGTWISVIRKGFEPAQPELLKLQEQATARQLIEATAAMRRTPTRPVVIRNAAVFDAEQRILRRGLSVRIRGDRIDAVGPDATVDTAGADVIDATGKVVLPGLWDMHVHVLSAEEGPLALLAGLTTVRDLGNDGEALQRLIQQFDDGTVAGPRVIKAGMIDGRGPLEAPAGTLVENAEQLRAAVDAYADRGYRQIKLYSSLPPALVPVGVAAARARGMRVSGHVPAGMTMREAVMAGFDEVQHANFWFLNFMDAETVAHTNSPIRFTAVYEHGRELDLASPQVRDFIALLKQKGTVVDPTLIVFENMFTGWKGEMARWMAPWAAQMPATSLRGARSGGRASTLEQRALYTESFTRMKQMLLALHTAGVPIVPGTDGTALLYPRELELHTEAGIAPADVLYSATLGSARVMHEDGDSGSVTPGKRADLVLIDGDPLARISDVRKTTLIIKGGVLYDARALAIAAGLRPR